MTHIIYIGDPMCSWCYGFGPELAGFLKAIPEPKLDIVMGGLRAGGDQVVTAEFRGFLLDHWAQLLECWGQDVRLESPRVRRYTYKRVYPHVNAGVWVNF